MKIGEGEWRIYNDNNDVLVSIDYYKEAFDVTIKDSRFSSQQWEEMATLIQSIMDSCKS
jgi:hypothetical protein